MILREDKARGHALFFFGQAVGGFPGVQSSRLHLESMKVSQSQHSEALQHGLNQHQAAWNVLIKSL